MTVYTPLIVLFCLLRTVPAPNSMLCRSCHSLYRDRSHCTQYHKCSEHNCFVEVHHLNGEDWYKFGCAHPDECTHLHNHDRSYGPIICRQCCSYTGCQMSACKAPAPTTAAPVPTTAAPTPLTTTDEPVTATSQHMVVTTNSVCVDNDDASFTCADMKYYGYCNPNAGAGYALAQKRCHKTCGFCP